MSEPASPVLYSFRRCPYAMRARLALQASGVAYELREVDLKNKPAHMLALSPKGSVPVLWWRGGPGQHPAKVIDQSLDIMFWALRQRDPLGWLPASEPAMAHALALIAHNDGPFKAQLDRYKYPQRFGLTQGTADRDRAAVWLRALDSLLQAQAFLAGAHQGLADAALAPFVRQFARTDRAWFEAQPWGALHRWLQAFEVSEAFAATMQKHALWADTAAISATISALAPNSVQPPPRPAVAP